MVGVRTLPIGSGGVRWMPVVWIGLGSFGQELAYQSHNRLPTTNCLLGNLLSSGEPKSKNGAVENAIVVGCWMLEGMCTPRSFGHAEESNIVSGPSGCLQPSPDRPPDLPDVP